MNNHSAFDEIETKLKKACWIPAAEVERFFVKFSNPKHSPGKIWRYTLSNTCIKASIIIPTLDANRNGQFSKLLTQISCQNCKCIEIIVIRGDPRQGRAINVGAAIAKGKYLITLDDDTSLPDPKTFENLIYTLEKHPEIGIAGGSNVIPQNGNSFIKRVMQEIPRRSWEPVKSITDSDLAEHPCMIMRTSEFKCIGGENELIPRGLDPYLREEYRKIGKRIVLVPKVVYHHLPPSNIKELLRQFFRNGRQAAYTNRNYPQWVIETPSTHGTFKAQATVPRRVFRFQMRLLKAFITGKPIWLLYHVSYALGFLCDFFLKSKELK